MALPGDDEIDSLLALMGGQTPSVNALMKATTEAVKKQIKEKSKKMNKKHTHKAKEGEMNERKTLKSRRGESKSPTRSYGDKKSFADTRLSQNCFAWPCSSDGRRFLNLGSGLLHDCKGYSCGCDGKLDQDEYYGSVACLSCGKSAATHELCISSSWSRVSADDAIKSYHPLSIISIAHVIVASRNSRCVIGEYHPLFVTDENQKKRPQIHEAHKNELRPPLNSVPCSPDMMSKALDVHTGRILASVKKMQNELLKPSHWQRHDKSQYDHNKLGSFASISAASDIEILQDKTLALIKTVQDYKRAIVVAGGNNSAVDLVEKRISAMASCDAVYFRCYYAAVVSPVSTEDTCGSVVAAIIPHPSSYYSCPGLAWDAQDAGSEALRAFLGECSDETGLASPFDDLSKQTLKSWGLYERLSSKMVGANVGVVANPLLVLWQSRFLESIRHLWLTRYSAVKFPMALIQAFQNNDSNASRPNKSQDMQLKIHETHALSLAVERWGDSVRDYPANFYAYAAPTEEALNAISNCLNGSDVEQILEAGAGTGYWSALLRLHLNNCRKTGVGEDGTHGLVLLAYDTAPPSLGAANEYHGEIPSFMYIHQADTFSQALSSSRTSGAKTALLLCYPPPGSDMAHKALSAHISHGGRTVIHIGEWQGLTGDGNGDFEALLNQTFSCQKKDVVPLPFWGTDATYLTIWRKKDKAASDSSLSSGVKACSSAYGYCSAEPCSNRARRRCRYARCLQYCSLECYEKHSSARRATLALHMIDATAGDVLKFQDNDHFMDLGLISTNFRESDGFKRPGKKRQKKRH